MGILIAIGLAGAGAALYYLSGNTEFRWETYQTLPAIGFNGIPVALLASNSPLGVIFSSMFMAYLDVAGLGFLALAVMIFGNWKPLNIALAALLFGLLKCISVDYAALDINGDGVAFLKDLGISAHIYRVLPYVITLVVLAFTSKKFRAPKAEGIPYDKGAR